MSTRKTEKMVDQNDLLENEDIDNEENESLEDLDDEDFEDEDFDEDEDEDEDEDLEESTGSETLKPHGGSGGGEYKAQMLATMTQLLSQLGKEDLSNLFTSVQNQYGPNKIPGATDNEGKNKSTIKAKASSAAGSSDLGKMPMPKLGVKEDVEEMFAGDDLSEEFKERAETIFEAALNTRVTLEASKLVEEFEDLKSELQEEYENKLEEEVNSILEDMTNKIDQYMNYCVEEWMEENKLAIENSLRTEIAEGFIESLKNVFAEHYIEVPEERFDILASLKEDNEDLREQLANALNEKIELESQVNGAMIDNIVDTVSEGLTETQKEKLKTLSEGLEFTNVETYEKKLKVIRENYFSDNKKSSKTGLIIETIDGQDTSDNNSSNMYPGMNIYKDAISKSIK